MHRQAGKVVALVCHGACVRLNTRLSSGHLVGNGRASTELANSEEAFADWLVGRMIQPFRIEEGAWRLPDTNFVLSGIFTSFAVRDGNLIAGHQRCFGTAAHPVVLTLGR